jgi:2-polyprenyl-3-methyl-5-hydroxy-6-metoxy-1,4-benzoquinol methylase
MKYKFSCVVDNKPIFKAQANILINSLIDNGKVNPEDIFVHLLDVKHDEFYIWLKELRINIIDIESFNNKNPYCNKLQQLATFKNRDDFDYVFLLDCDVAIVSLEGLELESEVYSKIVDFPNPPLPILKSIFELANIEVIEFETSFKLGTDNISDWNNCNGGLYILSKTAFKDIALKWIEYSTWCINNDYLFTENYKKHADQVGFALAMSSLNKKVNHLDLEWNFPIHIGRNLLSNIKPNIIHFHDCINEHMQLRKIGLNNVDFQIDKINAVISNKIIDSLNNSLFWDLRYALYPELGSGVGSRGDILEFKKNIIKYATYGYNEKNIIDVGCGDLELTKDFEFKNYIGLDVSEEALKISRNKRPDWSFYNNGITSDAINDTDLIMCFDVLIHQSKEQDFKCIIKSILEKAGERVIVGAYNEEPQYNSNITHYYNGILDEIKNYGIFSEIGIIAKYRDVSVVVATKHHKSHKRDISSKDLNLAFSQVKRPDVLQYLVDISRKDLGFFTSHYPRVFEYSWLYEQLENENKGSVLDIGAGVCPLPICLNENGMKVTTIDFHSKIRLKKNIKEWNEWGFLDYSQINENIKSINIDFSKLKTIKLYDFIYSISVIEHIPRKNRIKILRKAANLLKKNGVLLLTIDIIPNTNSIWNLSEDKEVDTIEEHGTISSLGNELNSNGFEILEDFVQRSINNSRTDVYYVKAILKKKKIFSRFFNLKN